MKDVQSSLPVLGLFLGLCLFFSAGLGTVLSAEKPSEQGQEYSDIQKKLLKIGITPKKSQKQKRRGLLMSYQKRLKELAYYTASIDGIVGPKTRRALLEFQRDVDLPLTGVFDEQTVAYLLRQTLILTTQDFPPFHYKIDAFKQRVYGPIPEVIRVVCVAAQINCLLRLYEWGQAQELVKQGKAHGMFVISWNAARAKFLHRSLPIIETEYGFFVRDDDPLTFTQIADIHEYTIGVYGPSNMSRTLRNGVLIENTLHTTGMRIHIKETRDDKPLFQELANGSGVRAVFSNKDVGNTVLKGLGLTNIRYAGQYKTLLYYVGFSKNLVREDLVEKFNETFRRLQRAGIVQEIYAHSGILGTFGDEEQTSEKMAKKPVVEQEKAREQKYHVQILDGQEIIADTTTCLMWQRHGSEKQVNWQEAQSYIAALNREKYASYADWRLPKMQELSSLLEKNIQKKNRLYIDPIFDATRQSCWSADGMNHANSNERQFIDFYEGSAASRDQLDTNFVRAVRGTFCHGTLHTGAR